MQQPHRVVIVGNGMVGHRFLEELAVSSAMHLLDVTVVGAERHRAYDRVQLSSWVDHRSAEALCLVEDGFADAHGITEHLGDPAVRIDRRTRTVLTASGCAFGYDTLVLATGSRPFVPPIPGIDSPGVHVYRTIDDLEAIAHLAAQPGVRRGAVLGGGLLGLEAANALRNLGLETHVVELADRLMPMQLDAPAAAALRRRIEALGLEVHTGAACTAIHGNADTGHPRAVELTTADDHPVELAVDLVVVAAGIRPEDALAEEAGLALGERGGVLVDAEMRTTDPVVWAIGECAAVEGRTYGLVAPGYAMARIAAGRLAALVTAEQPDPSLSFSAPEPTTKLKLVGVDVASGGDAHGSTTGCRSVVWDDESSDTYRKIVIDGDRRIIGAILVGDTSGWPLVQRELCAPTGGVDPHALVLPEGLTGVQAYSAASIPPEGSVCSCNRVTRANLSRAIAEGCHTVGDLKRRTRAGTGCGGCLPVVEQVLGEELAAAGIETRRGMCEHLPITRQELVDLVRIRGLTSLAEVVTAAGGTSVIGCEVCRPALASVLASLGNGYILDGEQAALQDTNDHALANLQRDGTYSVVPRIPGGEVTPAGLIAIGEVARDFGLYTKITGGQRIDLFGARLEQLPSIWDRLITAGFESGHAYGKAVRTVKSCVGRTWCRYGVQDSTAMAIALELRYRGLRAPHKIKMAVSGCVRECAEAQSKDVGVIATETGWNLYVGGNGGMRPRHADLLAEGLSDAELIRTIDRFLMYYVRTGDRLERTATWIERLEGGVDHVREVVIADSLGLADELEAAMAAHVASYEDEWAATLADPTRRARFTSYINAPDTPDPTIVHVIERGQPRPLPPGEHPGAGERATESPVVLR
ncbi:nitrite reductase large subunit NirB [Rhabdothermincola sp.]|mgnify:CR=1 FL=1|uniref:nitrite reductase large subunit NirB n=1 Tax=Rhabdothermincola sp. TaxID=2820405 RepID=UPI002FE3AEAC